MFRLKSMRKSHWNFCETRVTRCVREEIASLVDTTYGIFCWRFHGIWRAFYFVHAPADFFFWFAWNARFDNTSSSASYDVTLEKRVVCGSCTGKLWVNGGQKRKHERKTIKICSSSICWAKSVGALVYVKSSEMGIFVCFISFTF